MTNKSGDEDGRRALVGKRSSRKKQFTCHYCGKPGHFKRDCRLFAQKQSEGRGGGPKLFQGQSAHLAEEEKADPKSEEALVISQTHLVVSKQDWLVDSGATCHMCHDRSAFREWKKLQTPQQVALGDGYELEATAEGSVPMTTLLPNGETDRCVLGKVLYIPKLSYNLLSVSRAVEAGKVVKFTTKGCEFLNKENRCVAFAAKRGSLYHLEYDKKSQQHANTVTMDGQERLWHRRYGHLNEQSLRKLVQEELVDIKFNPSMGIGFCESCVKGKQCRSSFQASSTKTKAPLELVHSDVCGKMGSKSLGGAEYFLTFVDDFTHYIWVYPLKTKDQVFERLQEWKTLVENSSKWKLKVLRTDNGGEYTSGRAEAYLRTSGVKHELTIPKTPQQNGVAERLNRTLVETARSMLLDAQLPQKFWAEAISTAAYLRNRAPTSTVEGKTPYQAWNGWKPKVKHLRVFGSDAFAHVPKDERGKLDSKSKKCILLGYGERRKGYRLFDPEKEKVIYSRDVTFHEEEKKREAPKERVEERRIELESFYDTTPEQPEESPENQVEEAEAEAETEVQSGPGDLPETDAKDSSMEWRAVTCLSTESLLQSKKPWAALRS